MYQDPQTRVKTRYDTTYYFDVDVGLHQGSALSRLCIGIRSWHTPRWGLLFADELAMCAESSVDVEEELEKWRRVLEENVLKK